LFRTQVLQCRAQAQLLFLNNAHSIWKHGGHANIPRGKSCLVMCTRFSRTARAMLPAI
jgi:hypothetical protein